MISFKPFWDTLEKSDETQYTLIQKHGIPAATINRLKYDKNIRMDTLDKLCTILNCNITDIVEHIPDNDK